jgi:hypothetical protein
LRPQIEWQKNFGGRDRRERFLLSQSFAKVLALVSLLLVAGCGAVAPVVALDNDTYMVGSHGVLGNGSSAAERAKAVQAATEFCANKSMSVKVVHIESVEPFWGRAPSADVRFQCVSK